MLRICVMLLVSAFVVPCYAVESPKILKFKNNVVYDHEGHQGICNSCHDTLDGSQKITGFGKEWAHKNCIGCHTRVGSGPTSCKDCHKQ